MKAKTTDIMTETSEMPVTTHRKKSKKEKKAKKEKRKRKRDPEIETICNGADAIEDSVVQKSGNGCPLHLHDHSDNGNEKRKKDKKKKLKKKEKKVSKRNAGESDTESNDEKKADDTVIQNTNSGRLVASSAIEFYDDDLKKAKKRQKLSTKNLDSTSEAENEAGLEDALKKQRSKANKKKRNRSDVNDNDSGGEDKKEHIDELKQRDELDKVLIPEKKRNHSLTLLLFYQYIEPEWDDETHERMLRELQKIGTSLELTGRMRCAKEGLNCTLTGTHTNILEYTKALRQLRPKDFCNTEFKLTTDLPLAQKFGELKVLPVLEIVRYGLEGQKAPPIQQYSGVHLEPKDYHKKLAESNTVIIDVRNHYEAAIGRFVPPKKDESKTSTSEESPKWIDPKMRKSTEFPAWLDKDETKNMMKGKQVLMYCTGGIRCERASALLKYKMETDPTVKDLGIKGVFQLQGGIDKYFKEFPDGGYWKGKNYVFDKRFAHAPPKIDGELHGRVVADKEEETKVPSSVHVMGQCEACHKPWDMYRGKRRCPTCGVPSLICKDCFLADKEGRKKLGKEVRCDLCVEQGVFSKRQYREKEERFIQEYESKMTAEGLLLPNAAAATEDNFGVAAAPNSKGITRLVLKNMCRKRMTEDALLEALPGITHIAWNTQRNRKNPTAEPIFTGMGWVEMATPGDAAKAVAQNNKLKIFGRTIGIAFQAPDGKDVWPPPSSRVA